MFFFQAEDGIRDRSPSRGLGDVYKRQKQLGWIILKHNLSCQFYADDIQLYTSFAHNEWDSTKTKIEKCPKDIKFWMTQNFLKINANKTDCIIFPPKSTQGSDIDHAALKINFCNNFIPNSPSVKVLGTILNTNLFPSAFITKKYQVCMFHLRNLYHIRNCLPHEIRVMMIKNLVLSQLDYCNALLANATSTDLKPLKKF